MIQYIKEGWKATLAQPFLFVTLFVYRFVWGFILYSLVQSVVVPLLHRYPGNAISTSQTHLFLAESQFQLMKTDIGDHYLWLLLGLLLARVLLTPLLNAGIFFSLRHTDLNAGYRFFRGMKEYATPFAGYYLLQMILTLAPLYVLYPMASHSILMKPTIAAMLLQLLPSLLGWLAYSHLLQLIFMHLLFGKVWNRGAGRSLFVVIRSLLPILGISLLLLLTALLITGAAMSISLIWAGFWALILYQLYRFIDTFTSLWGIASQHELYMRKAL